MSDEAALRAAIRSVPLERTPRLVYADWLDEHDRPLDGALQRVLAEPEKDEHRLAYADACARAGDDRRAEFIRAQIELAALAPPREFWPTRIEFDPGISTSGVGTGRGGPCRARILIGSEAFAPDPRGVSIGDVIDLVGPVASAACEQSDALLGARVIESVTDGEHAGAIKFDVIWGTDHYADRERLNRLRTRERALMTDPGSKRLLPGPWALAFSHAEHVRAVSGSVFAAGARRGFVALVSGPAPEWLAHGDAICAQHPVEAVRLAGLPDLEIDDHGAAFDARLAGRHRWQSFDKARVETLQPVVLALLASDWPGITFEFSGS